MRSDVWIFKKKFCNKSFERLIYILINQYANADLDSIFEWINFTFVYYRNRTISIFMTMMMNFWAVTRHWTSQSSEINFECRIVVSDIGVLKKVDLFVHYLDVYIRKNAGKKRRKVIPENFRLAVEKMDCCFISN